WVRLRITYGSALAWAAVDPERRNAWEWDRANDSKVLGSGRGAAANRSRLAAVKYAGWTAYVSGLLTQLLRALTASRLPGEERSRPVSRRWKTGGSPRSCSSRRSRRPRS